MLTDVFVPHNRWDLLDRYPLPTPSISVVIVHFEQHAQLDRTCRALAAQTSLPLEVIVADDGSSHPPNPSAGGVPVRVVAQRDLGFRAAAARNLGAARATGEVLVFLDADTTPEPGFLAAITRTVARCPDALAVGRREHGDFTDVPLDADPRTARRLPPPEWLEREYARSQDLLHADGRSFRFVISAVLACRASLFHELGGFDERFVEYGGEDWDLAYRAWNRGAVLVRERAAVAWHDGPDWAGRAAAADSLDAQAIRLAALVPEPHTRGAPLPADLPDVLVDLAEGTDTTRTTHSLLNQTFRDLRVRLPADTPPHVADLYGANVHRGAWTPDQLRRCRARLTASAPLHPSAVETAMAALVDGDLGTVELVDGPSTVATLTGNRCLGRAHRWRRRFDATEVADLFGTAVLPGGSPIRQDTAVDQYFSASSEHRPPAPVPGPGPGVRSG
ncbi:glycosyltransferase family 2 protein [Actinokineospora sp. G85]|uniref:glycosyltransferase family 2 protein n=1 Tax=Actinokineospora sp. G85 TaxID=3406626 RepID=UPI003C7538F4